MIKTNFRIFLLGIFIYFLSSSISIMINQDNNFYLTLLIYTVITTLFILIDKTRNNSFLKESVNYSKDERLSYIRYKSAAYTLIIGFFVLVLAIMFIPMSEEAKQILRLVGIGIPILYIITNLIIEKIN